MDEDEKGDTRKKNDHGEDPDGGPPCIFQPLKYRVFDLCESIVCQASRSRISHSSKSPTSAETTLVGR